MDSEKTDRNTLPAIREKVRFLRQPEAYPDRPEHVETVETHMAWVFLTERHAFKLKKPVRTRYLDFSTVDARRTDCERELKLNRRLAPDVYQQTVPLTIDSSGYLQLGGPETVVDWLVQMRRLPRDRMLDVMIEGDAVTESDVRPAAELLARFYEQSLPADLEADEYRQRLVEGVEENRRELSDPVFDIPHDLATRLLDAQRAFVSIHPALFDERVRLGKIIEAHGDLRPEHICLEPQPVVIDSLEFNRDLRLLDVVSELPFFALECERLGAKWIGEQFLVTYARIAGDRPPWRLLEFYRCWHACTRARIALLHLRDGDVRAPEKWTGRARRYVESAFRFAADDPGTGSGLR